MTNAIYVNIKMKGSLLMLFPPTKPKSVTHEFPTIDLQLKSHAKSPVSYKKEVNFSCMKSLKIYILPVYLLQEHKLREQCKE